MRLENVLEENMLKLNHNNLNNLKNEIKNDQKISWVIGAGASKDFGIPLWSECLEKMWNRILVLERPRDGAVDEDDNSYFYKDLDTLKENIAGRENEFCDKLNKGIKGKKTKGSSNILGEVDALEAAEYIRNFVEQTLNRPTEEACNRAFRELVRDSLKPENLIKNEKEFKEDLNKRLSEKTIGILADFLIKRREKYSGRDNIIVYNFDDALEYALEYMSKDKGTLKQCQVQYEKELDIDYSQKGIFIYHPHGMVKILGAKLGRDSKELVLSQSGYGRLENKVYLWENSIQAQALLTSSCVFIGFSGTDYNFRRIIRNMADKPKGQQKMHYFFLSIQSMINSILKEIKVEGENEDIEKEKLKKLKSEEMVYERMLIAKKLQAQYLYWRKYGIIPIWTTRTELSEMIKYICEE